MLGVVITRVDFQAGKLYLEDTEAIFSEDTEKKFEVSLNASQIIALRRLFDSENLVGTKAFLDERSQTLHFDFVFKGNLECKERPTNSYR